MKYSKVVAAALAAFAVTSSYAQPHMTLDFVQASGVVSPTEDIPVWVRFTLDEELNFDFSQPAPYGMSPDLIPTSYPSGRPISNGATFVVGAPTYSYSCVSGAGDCMNDAYTWSFPDASDPRVFGYGQNDGQLKLDAGSYEYLAGTFKPRGEVAPGDYSMHTINFEIAFVVSDPAFTSSRFAYAVLASTCSQSTSCAFTRTVSAVPEPHALVLLAIGLVLLPVSALKRRK